MAAEEVAKLGSKQKMVLGIVLTVVTFVCGTIAGTVFEAAFGMGTLAGIFFRALVGCGSFIALGGLGWLRPNLKEVRGTWHLMRPLVMVNLALAAVAAGAAIMDVIMGGQPVPGLIGNLIYVTILCIIVGISEEVMFRGLMFGGLLAGLGNRKGGVLLSAVISSVAFGALHVIFDLNFANPWGILQGLLKTTECAMFGFILCVAVLEGRGLVGAITVHAFFDWVLLAAAIIAGGNTNVGTYVSADASAAIRSCVTFALLIILYTPRTIKAFRRLRAMRVPQYGPFSVEKSAALKPIMTGGSDAYVDADEGMDARIGRLRDHKVLNNKVLTILATYIVEMLLLNALLIPVLAFTSGTVQKVATAVITIAVAFLLLWGFGRQTRGQFKGVLNWSTQGLILVLPTLLMAVSNFLDINASTTINPPLLALILALAPGVSEEIVFRAIPASNWMRVSGEEKDIVPCVIATSAVFSIVHLINILAGAALGTTLLQVFYSACLAIVFCAVFLRCGSVWPTVIAHTLVDMTAFLFLDLAHNGIMTEEITFGFQLILILVLAVAAAGWGFYLVRPSKWPEIVALWKDKWNNHVG